MQSSPSLVARYSGFRPEIQGLRAVAVLMVVVYHVFIGRVSGGVDIFLLISAFFMTLSFVRKLEGERPLALGRYWLHTFKRLLPLAAATILVTSLLLAVFYPEGSVWAFRRDGLASIFYVENWHLAQEQADYYATDRSLSSPFQHFWSLSMQGQVFLLWPLIFLFASWIKKRFDIRPVKTLAVTFSVIFAVSLSYSIYATGADQAFAYFDTRARLWEFALGSLLALAIPFIKVPKAGRLALGWAGFVSMLSVGILIDVQGVFPGWIALWPLVSAAAIMAVGQSGSRFGIDRLLSWGPIVRLGDSAYALYLVHWPLLITYMVIRDRPEAGPRSGVVLVVASVALAVTLTRLIDEPLRRWHWAESTTKHMAIIVVTSVALASVPVGGWLIWDTNRVRIESEQAREQFTRNNPGAQSLMPDFVYEGDADATILPRVGELDTQWFGLEEDCTGRYATDIDLTPGWCKQSPMVTFPSKTVVVVGNSHSAQMMAAILPIAEEQNWQLVSLLQPGCNFTVVEYLDQCTPANEAFNRYVLDLHPDAVILHSTRSDVSADGENLVPGIAETIDELIDEGISVTGIRDNPRTEDDRVECYTKHLDNPDACTVPESDLLKPINPAEELDNRSGYTNLDFTDLICPDGQCPVVIGNVLMWLDPGHLSSDYITTMVEPARDRIVSAVEGGF